jgi:hypothetical protein
MRKTFSLMAFTMMVISLNAQWVNDPQTNTLAATGSSEYGEIYLSTHEASGNTFIQWNNLRSSGWNPSMQMINVDGVPQWGPDGIVVSDNPNETMSTGMAMVATSDGNVVSHFADIRNGSWQPYAVKINPEGEFVWGENGISTFTVGNNGAVRTEVYAGNDGGVWAVVMDGIDLFARYINADGTLNNQIYLHEDDGSMLFYPQAIVDDQNNIFIVYQKASHAYSYYFNKELYVVKYSTNGTQLHEPELLMSSVAIAGNLESYVIPDAEGGGYAWIWHPETGLFETYVFHFNNDGENTFPDTSGVCLAVPDGVNFHFYADGAVEPSSNDLIMAWRETDAEHQTYHSLEMNRLTETGEKLWNAEGITLIPTSQETIDKIEVNMFPDRNGLAVSYLTGSYTNAFVKAIGIDSNGNTLWNSDITTAPSTKALMEFTDGFHNGQLIFAWDDQRSPVGLYIQNLRPDGTLGIDDPCPAPEIEGDYYWNEETQQFGSMLVWNNELPSVLSFNIYRGTNGIDYTLIDNVDAAEFSYFDVLAEAGTYYYQITAVYADCESDPGMTVSGENHIVVEVTSVADNSNKDLVIRQDNNNLVLSGVSIENTEIYSINGQLIKRIDNNGGENLLINTSLFNNGIYVLRVMTTNHQSITKRFVVNN